jgi:tetratricopeptide (TPR) repeat protein
VSALTGAVAPDAWPRRLRFAVLSAMWRAAALIGPLRPSAFFHLGNLCYSQGRRDMAFEAWKQAADTRRGHSKALHNWGNALMEEQRWLDAARLFRRLAQHRADVTSRYQAGKCHLAAGVSDAAQVDFEACVRIDATHVGALEHLGRLALKRRDAAEARAWLRQALALATHPEAIHFLLGAADELARDPAAAFENYSRVKTEPLQSQAQQRMARLKTKLSNIETFSARFEDPP